MTTSKALQIHDAVYSRLTAPDAFDTAVFKTKRRTRMRKFQPDQLPALSVFLGDDLATPDVEPVAGEPHFEHNLTVGVQILLVDSDDDELFVALENNLAGALSLLLNDAAFNRQGPDAIHNGINRMAMRRMFTQTLEVPLAQIYAELHFRYFWDWPPNVPDDYKVLHIESRYPPGVDPTKVIQIVRQWEIIQ